MESRWAPCSLAVPVFTPALVAMQPLDFLPQPLELNFSEMLREAVLLEAALEAPSVPRQHEEDSQVASARRR